MRRVLLIGFSIVFLLLLATIPVLAENPGRGFYDFGVFALEDGYLDDALANFKKALDLEPENPMYLHYLGKAYIKGERYDDAQAALSQAIRLDPELPELQYDLGYLYFKTEEYSKAAELFEAVVSRTPDNVMAQYYTGFSYFKLQRYSRALGFFDKAIALSSTIRTNGSYYAGICHLRLDEYDQAIVLLEYVRDNATGALRENAVKLLENVREQQAQKPYQLYAKIGVRYDDNVRLDPLDKDQPGDEADWLVPMHLLGRYNIMHQGVTYTLGYGHYQTIHQDLSSFNLVGSMPELTIRHVRTPYTFAFRYLPSYFWLDGEDYLMRHRLQPSIRLKINQDFSARLVYGHAINNFIGDETRTGHKNDIGVDFRHGFRNQEIVLTGSLTYEDFDATDPERYFTSLKATVGLTIEMPREVSLRFSSGYEDKRYDLVDSPFYGVYKREDTRFYAGVGVSRPISEYLSVDAEYRYTSNDSNNADFRYRRSQATVSLVARY